MRNIYESAAAAAAVMVIAVGLIIVGPSPDAAAQFKQFALAVHNYDPLYSEIDLDLMELLIPRTSDERLGVLIVENGVMVEAVAVPGRDRDFVNIRLSSGETVPAYVVSSDDAEVLLMDADGEFALFVTF